MLAKTGDGVGKFAFPVIAVTICCALAIFCGTGRRLKLRRIFAIGVLLVSAEYLGVCTKQVAGE